MPDAVPCSSLISPSSRGIFTPGPRSIAIGRENQTATLWSKNIGWLTLFTLDREFAVPVLIFKFFTCNWNHHVLKDDQRVVAMLHPTHPPFREVFFLYLTSRVPHPLVVIYLRSYVYVYFCSNVSAAFLDPALHLSICLWIPESSL